MSHQMVSSSFGAYELEDGDLVLGGGELDGDTVAVGVNLPGLGAGIVDLNDLHVVGKVGGGPHVEPRLFSILTTPPVEVVFSIMSEVETEGRVAE